jgi:hypothetical protein
MGDEERELPADGRRRRGDVLAGRERPAAACLDLERVAASRFRVPSPFSRRRHVMRRCCST